MSPYRKPAEIKKKTFLESLSPEEKKLHRKVQRHEIVLLALGVLAAIVVVSGMISSFFITPRGVVGIALVIWMFASWVAGVVGIVTIIAAFWNSYSRSVERAQNELDRKKYEFEIREEDSE